MDIRSGIIAIVGQAPEPTPTEMPTLTDQQRGELQDALALGPLGAGEERVLFASEEPFGAVESPVLSAFARWLRPLVFPMADVQIRRPWARMGHSTWSVVLRRVA